ncbi:MAG: DUF2232 domain-containing protein [Deltaproteobacteria bacterium]|nr:DUF2232 domain-containing protein [Deltaproteobacteria bacterium]
MSRLEPVKSFVLALASTAVLFLSAVAVPLVGFLLIPLVPQPALAFGLKHGRVRGVGLLGLGTVLFLWFGGRELALGFGIVALMVILLYGSLGKGRSIESVIAGTAAGMLAAVWSVLVVQFGSFEGVREVIRGALRANLELSVRVYEQIGFSQESMAVLRERAPQLIEIALQVLPALTFLGFGVVILINVFFLRRRFPDRDRIVQAGDLREWRSPEPLVWCLIVSGFALFVPGWRAMEILALNFFLVIAALYFFQGLAIVAYYFHHKNVPVALRSLAYALIILEQMLALLVVGLGLFDLWGDFRRLKKKDLNPSQAS